MKDLINILNKLLNLIYYTTYIKSLFNIYYTTYIKSLFNIYYIINILNKLLNLIYFTTYMSAQNILKILRVLIKYTLKNKNHYKSFYYITFRIIGL